MWKSLMCECLYCHSVHRSLCYSLGPCSPVLWWCHLFPWPLLPPGASAAGLFLRTSGFSGKRALSEFPGLIGLSGDDIALFLGQQLPLWSFLVWFPVTLLNSREACRDFCIFSTLPGSQAQLRGINSNFQVNYAAWQWPFPGAASGRWVVRTAGDVVSFLKLQIAGGT